MSIDLNQIAAQIRAEGYDEGYAACLRDMEAYLSGKKKMPAQTDSMKNVEIEQQNTKRAPKGHAKAMVLDVFQNIGGRSATAKSLQEMIELLNGEVIPYSSIQNAMAQLTRDGIVVLVGRGEWKLKTNTAPDAEAREAALNAFAFD